MKKLAFIIALCTASSVFAEDQQPNSFEDQVIEGRCGADKMWLPEGAEVVATAEGTLSIQAPEGWVYVGYDADGAAKLLINPVGTCSCTCTENPGSCNPSIFKGNCSCTATDGCTACDLSVGAASPGAPTVGASRSLFEGVTDGGYIHLNTGVSFAKKGEELPMAFDLMFDHPLVQKTVEDWLARIYPDSYRPEMIFDGKRFQAPAGYVTARLNVFGRAAAVLVPEMAAPKAAIGGGSGSCDCTNGTCTFGSRRVPPISYCEGSCSGTCTLTIDSDLAPNQDPAEVSK